MQNYKPEFLYLTTIGHKTGNPHEIEIWYVPYDGRYYLVAERRDQTHWVQNIRQNPAISFYVEGQMHRGTGREIDPASEPELAAVVSKLMDEKYRWSDGLIVELAPR